MVLLLDTQTKIEKKLIDQYIQEELPENVFLCVLELTLREENASQFNVDAIADLIDESVEQYYIPLRVVWTVPKSANRLKRATILDVLFAGRYNPGKFQQYLLQKRLLKSKDSKPYVVAAGKGASLQDLKGACEKSSVEMSLARYICRSAFLALEQQERMLKGARYKIPRMVAVEVLRNPELKKNLEEISAASGRSLADVEKDAESCLKEMAATPSPNGLDLVSELGRFMYTRGFEEELDYLPEDVERVRQITRDKPVAFVFTHKSHIDGFLLYTFFHDLNLPPVHTFGGINMGFFGLGAMLRHAGAILIRRTFGTDEVYKAVFKTYIDYLGQKRFPVMWSLEGTRSRTGKLMPPRFGLINYVISAYLKEDDPDLMMIPISIVYDQIPEVSDYDSLQAGGEKRKESALWFLQYLKGLKNPYGKIHIRFGQGVEIGDYVENSSGKNVVDRRAMQKLAFDLAVDTNSATPITVNSLICYVLLENGHRAISFAHMKREINRLLNFVDLYNFPVTAEVSRITDKLLKQALQQLSINSVIEIAEDGLDDVYMIPHGKARLAAYYRNGLIQFFITPAIAELAALSVQSTGDDAIEEFHQEALRIRDLMKYEFFFEGSEQFIKTMESQLTLRDPAWREAIKSGRETIRALAQEQPLLIAHGTLRPFLEAYMVFAKALSLVDAETEVDPNGLIKQSLALGHQGVLQQRIHCEESVSQNYFENAVKIADGRGLFNPVEDIIDKRHQLVGELKAIIVNTRFLASVTDSRRNDELTSIPL